MITIDNCRCTACGRCLPICHEKCIFLVDNTIRIDYAVCSTCAQCIAVCPTHVFGWDGAEAIPFDETRFPSTEQVDELLKQRRTIRTFKPEKPDRQLLETIIQYGAYAPAHSHEFRVIVVDDDGMLQQIDNAVLRNVKKIHRYIFKNRLIQQLIKRMPGPYAEEFVRAIPKIKRAIESGHGYENIPPAIIFIIGDRRYALSLESAQYILYNMNLIAMAKGLGCRNLVGNQMFFNKNRKLRSLLGLGKYEKIYAVMGIGFSKRSFRNKVAGREMPIRWI